MHARRRRPARPAAPWRPCRRRRASRSRAARRGRSPRARARGRDPARARPRPPRRPSRTPRSDANRRSYSAGGRRRRVRPRPRSLPRARPPPPPLRAGRAPPPAPPRPAPPPRTGGSDPASRCRRSRARDRRCRAPSTRSSRPSPTALARANRRSLSPAAGRAREPVEQRGAVSAPPAPLHRLARVDQSLAELEVLEQAARAEVLAADPLLRGTTHRLRARGSSSSPLTARRRPVSRAGRRAARPTLRRRSGPGSRRCGWPPAAAPSTFPRRP